LDVGATISNAFEPERAGAIPTFGSSGGAEMGAGPEIGVTGVVIVEASLEGVSAVIAGGVLAAD
jgi:hypothetical protein